MRYRIIVSRAMFDFSFTAKKLRLNSVRFLGDSQMVSNEGMLLVRDQGGVDAYLPSSTPVAEFSREQLCFAAAVTRFLGFVNPRQLQLWFWSSRLSVGERPTFAEAA